MRINIDEFLASPNKAVTLMGMSGVGKTYISNILEEKNWYHFSADYRIGHKYLNGDIEANLRDKAMTVPFLRELLENDSISISNNVTINNLSSVSAFLGKVGNPEKEGMALPEFLRRQKLYLEAEIASAYDVPKFIEKAHAEGHNHFINDSTGSLCEIDEPGVFEVLAKNTLILYIKTSPEDEIKLIERAQQSPKPLYYRQDFILEQLSKFQQERALEYLALMEPDDFIRWVFPNLFQSRLPRYQHIADNYGYTVQASELATCKTEADFIDIITASARR